MNKAKEAWQNLDTAAKRLLVIVLICGIAFVAIGTVLINRSSRKTEYTTLFTGLSQDEAKDIVGEIQDKGTKYLYDASTGTIQVPQEDADKLRAEMLSEGYPKSGFTYSMYVSNSNIMATESDKKQYSLYDLQDRLGATIRLFDGVQDAKVTIAEGDSDSYVLDENGDTNDSDKMDASASVVVTMQRGETLNEKNADAIRNLVARSVNGINFTNVSVFDAATMTEVGGSTSSSSSGTGAVNDMTTEVEENIAANVKRVLGKIYKEDNVEVSVRGILNPSSTISEDTRYSVPVQSGSDDKEGLLSKEDESNAYSGNNASGASGVAGSDANADTPEYTTNDGTAAGNNGNFDSSASREWLYNTQKQQVQTDAGSLEDCTVAVVIDTDDTTVSEDDLTNLIADAAGISREDAPDKITIVRSKITKAVSPTPIPENEDTEAEEDLLTRLLPAAIAVAGLLVLIIVILLLLRKKKKDRERQLEEEEILRAQEEEQEARRREEASKTEHRKTPTQEEMALNEHVERGMQLKDSIGDFVDDNPQAAAKLIQSWLREGDDSSGRKHKK
ncbi:flagellar basal-body MS-ring/collar protein FliF [Bilifractor sp. LCP21S3_A7]|uniref:flagellar basal-body MS-ring/collar protein FliF n=1 Tax=Bilifractor sp. LCP21S3_A7 TaxID=3438738 RepID=UPI003F93D39C